MKYRLCEDGYECDTIEADSIENAIEIAKENVDFSNYGGGSTLWIDVSVYCVETDEREFDTVTLHPPEPECTEAEHDFRSSYKLFGGIEVNPGVWGSGGGVIIYTVCCHCGCKRVEDTWAQRRDTGEQGLTSITYVVDEFSQTELDEAFL